jgi:DNA replication protein DnaC
MIITTNRSPSELCNWITPAAVDRLFEMGSLVEFQGKSYRLEGAAERAVNGNPMEQPSGV